MANANLYFEIPELSVTADLMYIRAATAPQSAWMDYYNFKALEVKSDWAIDPWWRELYKAHPFRAGIIKLEKNTYYDWHVDTDRGVGLNLLLNNWDYSHCMFNPTLRRGKTLEHGNVTDKFIEMKYDPHTYYLFNTQIPHTVYNFKGTRYLLSVDFEEDKTKLTYKQLLKEMKHERWWER